jgi:hypothetical protein
MVYLGTRLPSEEYPAQPARPNGGNSPQVLRTEFREPGSTASMPASSTLTVEHRRPAGSKEFTLLDSADRRCENK